MKKYIAMALSLVLGASFFVGCQQKVTPAPDAAQTTDAAAPSEEASTEAAPQAQTGEKMYIAMISKGFQHQFWQAVKQGADKAATEFDITISFEGPENETQVDKQIELLDAAMAKNPNAVCLAALDTQAVLPQLQKLQAQNVPVVGFDSGVESDIVVATASTSNINAAAAAADKMAEAIGSKGKVGVVVHDQTSITGQERRDGFINRIKEKYPEIELIEVQYGGGDHLKSADIAKSMIAANTDLKGIFGSNEGSAVGVMIGVEEAKKTGQVVVIGFDAGKDQKEFVRSGKMYGAISQDPVAIGYEAVKAAYMSAKGEKVEKNIDTGYQWYDSKNVDSPEMASILYD